jgi:ribonuclease HI
LSSIPKVQFIFINGHAGVQGNERADRLSDCVVIEDGQPTDHGNIVNNLTEIDRNESFERREETRLLRMK